MTRARDHLSALAAIIVLAALLSACAVRQEPIGDANDDDDAGAALIGTEWVLEKINDQPALAGTRVTMQFDNGRVGGFGGCNSYGGDYEVDGLDIQFSDVFSTAMACNEPENVMDQEAEFHRILSLDGLIFEVSNGRLEIADAGGGRVLELSEREAFDIAPSDLAGTHWQLVAFDDGDAPLDDSNIHIRFGSREFHGNAGCREFEGSYSAEADTIRVSTLAMLSHECARPEAFLNQEHRMLDVISSAAYFNIEGDRLELHGQTGGVTELERLPDDADIEPADAVWTLDRFVQDGEAIPVIDDTEITMTFAGGVILEEGDVGGTAGCNQYGAEYSAINQFEISSWEATEMACFEPDGVMEQEQMFLDILGRVTSLIIHDNELSLETDGGERMIFVPAE